MLIVISKRASEVGSVLEKAVHSRTVKSAFSRSNWACVLHSVVFKKWLPPNINALLFSLVMRFHSQSAT